MSRQSRTAFRVTFLLAAVLLIIPSIAWTADLTLQKLPGDRVATIVIKGTLEEGDDKKFIEMALHEEDAVVDLKESPGGFTSVAFSIGRFIKAKRYSTLVENSRCVSSCALIWLAGSPRIFGKNAEIGFHAPSLDGQVTSQGSAIVGAYAFSLGLSEDTIAAIVTASPDSIEFFDAHRLKKVGISFEDRSPSEVVPPSAYKAHNQAVDILRSESPDLSAAIDLYRSAAEAGLAGSQNNLGDLYEFGRGVEKNLVVAIYWFARAAERGEPTAYLSLAQVLSQNSPDMHTLKEATKFAILASEKLRPGKNRGLAEKLLKELRPRLSESQFQRAEESARQWRPLFYEPRLMGDAR